MSPENRAQIFFAFWARERTITVSLSLPLFLSFLSFSYVFVCDFAARDANLSSFTAVFSAETLERMAEMKPMTQEEMLDISGVTISKYNKFNGERFLNITQNYVVMMGRPSVE